MVRILVILHASADDDHLKPAIIPIPVLYRVDSLPRQLIEVITVFAKLEVRDMHLDFDTDISVPVRKIFHVSENLRHVVEHSLRSRATSDRTPGNTHRITVMNQNDNKRCSHNIRCY